MVSRVKPNDFGQKPDPVPFGVHESNKKSSGNELERAPNSTK
jgi:hypothetical protein